MRVATIMGRLSPPTTRVGIAARPREGGAMKVEVLYFGGCPFYITAEKTLREVLGELGLDAEVETVAVETDEEAGRFRFPGSPTIRIDGDDLFPSSGAEREDWRLGCRIYATPEGFKGSPTPAMIEEALTKKGAADAGLRR
jgi:hypothetical protein